MGLKPVVSIQGAGDTPFVGTDDMGINHGRTHVVMTKQFLSVKVVQVQHSVCCAESQRLRR